MKILLIEPDRLLAGNYRESLELAGHEARVEQGGQSAVHALEEFTPDIIVLELQMPTHNGVEFLYELRSYTEWQDIPVIILSLVPEEAAIGDAQYLRQLGVKAYLYKPQAKLRHLIRAVERIPQPVSA